LPGDDPVEEGPMKPRPSLARDSVPRDSARRESVRRLVRRGSRTPSFRGSRGELLPGSVAEVGYVTLGGLHQWVLIRGASLENPPLILLHGGPGFSETHFFRRFMAPLERVFTVVYWDQRGSGKSYSRAIPSSSMTTEQFIADLDELVDTVRRRLGKERVVLYGHSWGTVLGVLYAARFPQKVAAYAGSGQIGDWQAAESASYAYALAEAQRLGECKALEELRAIGPPPYSARSLWKERTWLQRFEGQLSVRGLGGMARDFICAPELSLLDLPGLTRGFRWSLDVMWEDVSRLDLIERAPSLEVPVAFLLGRRDRWVPPETSVAYFEALSAPSKELVWFERSGHEPFVDEPAAFRRAMVEVVRTAVRRAGG
jgi:pimeloyl-ACP methyl ester carboxylesterase